MIKWKWCRFEELSLEELYGIFSAREAVFVVEQDCPYQDVDGLDFFAHHLIAWDSTATPTEIAAYLRVVDAGKKYPELSIGRVLTNQKYRRKGLGRQLMAKAIENIQQEHGQKAIRISAQEHLQDYYGDFGFYAVSEPYDEDGIPHVEMFREA